MPHVALRDIVEQLGGELIGDGATLIDAIRPLETATENAIAFVSNPRYRSQLAQSRAGCVIVAPALRDAAAARGASIVSADPYVYFARLTRWWAARSRAAPAPGVHTSAWVDPTAQVDASATVAAFAVVEAGASVAAGAFIGAHSVVGALAAVGAGTRLAAHVTLGAGCTIGARSIVHGGVVIGADGFGFAPHEGRWEKIEQFGFVRIGDDVEIGANTCIDRGALDDTVIEDGVKLDNLIQIGHNVRIGAHTVLAGCTGVSGSTTIGRHCAIGGAVSIAGHLQIANHVQITGCTVVTHSLLRAGTYSGAFPIDDNASWVKNAATLRQLHAMRERLRAVEKQLAEPTDSTPAGGATP